MSGTRIARASSNGRCEKMARAVERIEPAGRAESKPPLRSIRLRSQRQGDRARSLAESSGPATAHVRAPCKRRADRFPTQRERRPASRGRLDPGGQFSPAFLERLGRRFQEPPETELEHRGHRQDRRGGIGILPNRSVGNFPGSPRVPGHARLPPDRNRWPEPEARHQQLLTLPRTRARESAQGPSLLPIATASMVR